MKDTSKWFPFPYVLAIAILLTVIVGLKYFFLSQIHNKPAFDFDYHLLHPFINYGFWAFLSPLVWNLLMRFRPGQGSRTKNLTAWILGGIGLSVFHEVSTNILYYGTRYLIGDLELSPAFNTESVNRILAGSFSRYMEFWILFLGLTIWGYYQAFKQQKLKLAEMKSELFEIKLEALKAQLQPHFLFNTLNSVSALMTTDVQAAQKVLSNLAQLLRTLLKQDGDHVVTLNQELEFVRNYLQIELVRFSDRLEVCYDIDPLTSEALVPKLILQPLVENSIKHGISKSEVPCKILISSRKNDRYLYLTVKDDGAGMSQSKEIWEVAGVGLKNTRERLRQLYGTEQHIEVVSEKGREFQVNLKILFERS